MKNKKRIIRFQKALMVVIGAFFGQASAQSEKQVPPEFKVPKGVINKLDNLPGKWQFVIDMSSDNGKIWQPAFIANYKLLSE